MNSRARVRAAAARQQPDRVPYALYDTVIGGYNASTLERFQARFGRHPEEVLPHDLRGLWLAKRNPGKEWGARFLACNSPSGIRAIMEDWIPSPADPAQAGRFVRETRARGVAAVIMSSASDFETTCALRGREQFYMDIADGSPALRALLEAVTEGACRDARLAAAAGADIYIIGDDLGSQRGLLISPAHWRDWFKPCLRRIVETVKSTRPETFFFLHTDGMIADLIPDFIEVGVDILNPIQPEVLDPAAVKREYGAHLAFCGAISVQHTLPFGTPADVRAEVRRRMETIGAGGGYIMTPSHLLNDDIPWENIDAFFEAAREYGGYE